MTEEQFAALAAWVREEAEYAAREAFNQNDCRESLLRDKIMQKAKEAFCGKIHRS